MIATPPPATVIFVHGLWMTGLEMFRLHHAARAAGFRVRRFRYWSLLRTPEDNLARLHAFVQREPAQTVHFVGHSLGGILILKLLMQYTNIPPGRVVLLGAPVRGSAVARRIQTLGLGSVLLGKAASVLAVRHAPDWDGRREVGVIAGTRGIGVGRLFCHLPLPHDGTVAAEETALANATDSVQLPVTHTSMVYSATVARQLCAFLRTGMFSHNSV